MTTSAALPHRHSDDAPAADASPLALRHERLRRLRACEYLHRLARARLDLATVTDGSVAQLLAEAGLPVDLEWQAHQVLCGPVDDTGLFELSALVQRLGTRRREIGWEVEELTGPALEQLRHRPSDCLP